VWERLIDSGNALVLGGIGRRDPGVDRIAFAVELHPFMIIAIWPVDNRTLYQKL